ncbi:response regulator [Streptomyces antibioticus]|uniref:response regulator n=1 Tax=Streptomyces antibioticus TaxID=1890 RepID=UPI003701633D
MPEEDGLAATRRIVSDERLSDVRVVILTTFDVDDYVYGALRAGAAGFLVKDTEPMELLHGIRVRGDALIAECASRVVQQDASSSAPTPRKPTSAAS